MTGLTAKSHTHFLRFQSLISWCTVCPWHCYKKKVVVKFKRAECNQLRPSYHRASSWEETLTCGQSPLGSCLSMRTLIPLSMAPTSGCLWWPQTSKMLQKKTGTHPTTYIPPPSPRTLHCSCLLLSTMSCHTAMSCFSTQWLHNIRHCVVLRLSTDAQCADHLSDPAGLLGLVLTLPPTSVCCLPIELKSVLMLSVSSYSM